MSWHTTMEHVMNDAVTPEGGQEVPDNISPYSTFATFTRCTKSKGTRTSGTFPQIVAMNS